MKSPLASLVERMNALLPPTNPLMGVFPPPYEQWMGEKGCCKTCLHMSKIIVLTMEALRSLLDIPPLMQPCVFEGQNCLFCFTPRNERTNILRIDRYRCWKHRNCQSTLMRSFSILKCWYPSYNILTCHICGVMAVAAFDKDFDNIIKQLTESKNLTETKQKNLRILANLIQKLPPENQTTFLKLCSPMFSNPSR